MAAELTLLQQNVQDAEDVASFVGHYDKTKSDVLKFTKEIPVNQRARIEMFDAVVKHHQSMDGGLSLLETKKLISRLVLAA